MKKLLGIIVLGLLWCNISTGEIKLIEEELVSQGTGESITISTVCVDGYKFVTVYDQAYDKGNRVSVSTSITQMFVRVPDKDLSLPQRCG
jgi:hypothetical protein